ncbi:MAG: PKD domain-containing protein [Ekhidna sp.]
MNVLRPLTILICLFGSLKSNAQCPTSNFSIGSDGCINENIEIINTSTLANQYNWNFCDGELSFVSNVSNIYNVTEGSALRDLVAFEDDSGVTIIFLLAQNNALVRMVYPEGILGIREVTSFGDIDGALSNPRGLAKVNNELIIGDNTGNISRIEFGGGFTGDITNTSSILGYTSDLSGMRGIDLLEFGGEMILYVVGVGSNNKDIVVLEYNTDFSTLSAESAISIAGAHGLTSISFIRDCSDWYGLTAGFLSGVYKLDFGNDPRTLDSFENISGISIPLVGDFYWSNNTYYSYMVNDAGNLFRLDFGGDLSDIGLTSISDLGNFSFSFPSSQALSIFYEGSSPYMVLSSLNTRNISLVEFEDFCSGTSTEENPVTTFNNSGTFNIALESTDSDGNISRLSKPITISSNIAPSAPFSVNENSCLSNALSFMTTNAGLTTYSWDFDGDGIEDSAMENPDPFNYSTAGTYSVRLDVSDGTCDNFFEQEITIYDPPPAPAYTFTSPRTCINADFTFTNTTVDAGYSGPLQYLWEFIDEPSGNVVATADTKDAVYAFLTAGQKTVRLTSSIPGCAEVIEQTLMITPGPTANFFAASVCQSEAMQFTNTSTDATSYSWDFGDGFMSSATNPTHIFSGAGNFNVILTAIDAEGCEDTEVIEVAISDSPQITFDFDVPCTSSDGTQFFDLTTVDNADLVSWTWFVDDLEVSTAQSPQIVFATAGVKNIRLDVQSSNGCESSYSEDIEVLASPVPDFNISLGCQGEGSTFTDNTTSTGNSIVSWLWTVDGVNYGTQDINHVFSDAGTYDVTLEVTGQNFCSETITKSVEIIALPEVVFSVVGACDNQIISATDQSMNSVDPVVSRRWMLDGSNVGNGSQLLLSNLADNTYELALELETQAGCIISSSQVLQINNAPESSFTSSRTYGIPEDRLTFTNTSVGGISYQWLLDGELRSTDSQTESITFTTAGTYNLSLVTQNSLGCNDTTTQEILIAIPEVDLAIGNFELVRENNTGRIFLEVQNLSNLPVEITEAEITLENTFTISEQILEFIDVGGSSLVSLNVGIPLEVSEPSYFCVRLFSQYTNYADIQPINNEKCITIEPIIQLEDPFPNPVTDQFRLKLIVNENSTVSIALFNSAGKMELSQMRNVSEGLNNFFVDMSTFNPGIYYVIVETLGVTHKRKIIKL